MVGEESVSVSSAVSKELMRLSDSSEVGVGMISLAGAEEYSEVKESPWPSRDRETWGSCEDVDSSVKLYAMGVGG